MEPTKRLPDEYNLDFSLNFSENRLAMIGLNILAVFLFVLTGYLFTSISGWLRPDFWESGIFNNFGMIEIISFIAALIIMVVLHEGVHGIFFWYYTKERPRFGFNGLYTYAGAPEWYLPRNQFMITGLAPLVLLSIPGVVLMLVFPHKLLPALIFFLTFNASGAIGDILTIFFVMTRPPTSLIQDIGDQFTIYSIPLED